MKPLRLLPAALLLAALPVAAQNKTEAPAAEIGVPFELVDGLVDLTPTPEEMAAILAMTAPPVNAMGMLGTTEQPLAAYPNPSAGRATVRFTLDQAATVRLAVHDLLGREVAVLAEGAHAAGTHEAAFDGSALAAGVYVVRLDRDGAVETRRLTLMR